MAEELPESLARTESVLQPGAVIQLQSDADLRDRETESRRGGGRCALTLRICLQREKTEEN